MPGHRAAAWLGSSAPLRPASAISARLKKVHHPVGLGCHRSMAVPVQRVNHAIAI